MEEIYYLKDDRGYAVGMIKIEEATHGYVDGTCYEFNTWC